MSQGDLTFRALHFSLGARRLAIDANDVREVVARSAVTPVPWPPPHVEGIMDLRGKPLCVLSLDGLLAREVGREETEGKAPERPSNRIIVLESEGSGTGFGVDSIVGIVRLLEKGTALGGTEDEAGTTGPRTRECLCFERDARGERIPVVDLGGLVPRGEGCRPDGEDGSESTPHVVFLAGGTRFAIRLDCVQEIRPDRGPASGVDGGPEGRADASPGGEGPALEHEGKGRILQISTAGGKGTIRVPARDLRIEAIRAADRFPLPGPLRRAGARPILEGIARTAPGFTFLVDPLALIARAGSGAAAGEAIAAERDGFVSVGE